MISALSICSAAASGTQLALAANCSPSRSLVSADCRKCPTQCPIGKHHRDGEPCPAALTEEESITVAVAVWKAKSHRGQVGVYAGVFDLEGWMNSTEPYTLDASHAASTYFNAYTLDESSEMSSLLVCQMLVATLTWPCVRRICKSSKPLCEYSQPLKSLVILRKR